MSNIIYNSNWGDDFFEVSKKAKNLSINENQNVEFEFNNIICIVSKNTNLEWLWRDYSNAHKMEWKQIGPDCLPDYQNGIKEEIDRRDKEQKKKEETRRKEIEMEEKNERDTFNAKTKGIEFEISDKEKFNKCKENNTDPYGAAIIEYAECWAKLMQVEISNGKKIEEVASKTSYELGFLGISGFMYGAAVSILSTCWKHGEELRKWHNKEYNHEGEGVVNPAVLTISKK